MSNAPAIQTMRKRFRILRRPTESIRPSTPRPQRRDCHGRLAAALIAKAGGQAGVAQAGFRPWCSATFIGAQHRMTLRFAGPDALARATEFAAALPEADLPLPGHIVADATVDALNEADDGAVLVELAILTIEDW